ncbi:hypothetical protein [Catenulispora subtropica]|uniref:Integral membrane protein n=1 Tax=Catenulispora subtropica TaxID=450798 RepID=A0ABP5EB66_9ACTN
MSTLTPAADPQRAERLRAEQRARERGRWTAIGLALAAMVAVVGGTAWLVLGAQWFGPVLGGCVAAIALGAFYTVAGRTVGMNGDVRERVLERHYIGVAWYASMLRTTREPGGYERGLRRELTRLAAARLAERHGVNLYRDPRTAAALIGPDLWSLVDPALLKERRGVPKDAVPLRAVIELIDRLERM